MVLAALSPEKRRDLVLSVKAGGAQRPLSPIEVAEALDVALQSGDSFAAIASELLMDSTSTLRELHRLTRLAMPVRHLVTWGRAQSMLSMTTASLIGRLSGTADQEELAVRVLGDHLSADEVREIVELALQGRPVGSAAGEVVGRRPVVERQHVLMGAITSEDTKSHLRAMSQAERNALLTRTIARLYPGLNEAVASLGSERFTLVSKRPFDQIEAAGGDEIEGKVNDALRAGAI